jgi:hypothetical protein
VVESGGCCGSATPGCPSAFDGRWLILAGPHESATPADRWVATSEELAAAVDQAQAELEEFASMLEPAVVAFVGKDVVGRVARRLAGLEA